MRLHEDVVSKKSIRRFSTLLADFKSVHEDKYDYSNVVFISTTKKSQIFCTKER